MAQLGALGFRPRPLPPTSPLQRNPGAGGIGCQWLLPALGSFLSLRTAPLVTPCPCVRVSVCALGSALLVCWPVPGPVQCPSPAVTPHHPDFCPRAGETGLHGPQQDADGSVALVTFV